MEKLLKQGNNPKGSAGFSVVEMVVTAGIFAVIMTIILATYLNVNNIQRKATGLRAINDNVNFALELMSREIRAGKNYSTIGSSFSFTNAVGENITYSLSGGSIIRTVGLGQPLILTSQEVTIDMLKFTLIGEPSSDDLQPMVTINLKSSAGEKLRIKTVLNVQTTICQRKPDS